MSESNFNNYEVQDLKKNCISKKIEIFIVNSQRGLELFHLNYRGFTKISNFSVTGFQLN